LILFCPKGQTLLTTSSEDLLPHFTEAMHLIVGKDEFSHTLWLGNYKVGLFGGRG